MQESKEIPIYEYLILKTIKSKIVYYLIFLKNYYQNLIKHCRDKILLGVSLASVIGECNEPSFPIS
jgi:hypothetical protein